MMEMKQDLRCSRHTYWCGAGWGKWCFASAAVQAGHVSGGSANNSTTAGDRDPLLGAGLKREEISHTSSGFDTGQSDQKIDWSSWIDPDEPSTML
ncbi:hypothetical protein WR25_23448 [Diploscapter pachys]|uniref:Uncharacterized protein n=1 Tax=Diploscapter pachys TaxID=2018661 RepID=A0A2A2KQH7_9BILA|nr:hypothetical protein WR25_23448 [Diploscapter pachys]